MEATPESSVGNPDGNARAASQGLHGHTDDGLSVTDLQRLLRVLAVATFLVFFQGFMVAPLIPVLAEIFNVTPRFMGFVEPAYLLPYGAMVLVWGPLSDRIGRRRVILGSMGAFVVLTALATVADSAGSFLTARTVIAIGASGIVPVALALVGDVFPFQQRGRALGWIFGAMAGGIAVGSSAGALIEPVLGWRGLFIVVSGLGSGAFFLLWRHRSLLTGRPTGQRRAFRAVAYGYLQLLGSSRARRTYAYVLFNGVLHAGIYTWLGLYFVDRYDLGEIGIGLALLGYGIPGFLLGPAVGRLADHHGRARLIPLGLTVAAMASGLLALSVPVGVAALAVALLSLGYDLTQPLLAAIVTDLSTNRGQAMALNVFTLFIGLGTGSLAFQALLPLGISAALALFAGAALVAGGLAVAAFATEGPGETRVQVSSGP